MHNGDGDGDGGAPTPCALSRLFSACEMAALKSLDVAAAAAAANGEAFKKTENKKDIHCRGAHHVRFLGWTQGAGDA